MRSLLRADIARASAGTLVRIARSANKHMPAILAGTASSVISDSGYITMGGPDEATDYVAEWGQPGAAPQLRSSG
jgi:hypothetical protein